ncbi:hypothetical protein [Methylomagnum sp.]
MLLNFAGNAIKFTERGAVALRARLVEDAADSAVIRFEVRDTGRRWGRPWWWLGRASWKPR